MEMIKEMLDVVWSEDSLRAFFSVLLSLIAKKLMETQRNMQISEESRVRLESKSFVLFGFN